MPYEPKPNTRFDRAMLAYCGVIAFIIIGILLVAQYAALIKLWPYNLTLTLHNYDFSLRAAATGGP